jgi:hypothetical protein
MKLFSNVINLCKGWVTVERVRLVLFVLILALFVIAAGAPESGGIFVR